MRIMTIGELAELLGVKPKTLYQWAELRQVPSIKINGTLRFDFDDIEQWINSCKKETIKSYNLVSKLEAQGRRAVR